jgi:hypothetical protein
VPVLGLCQRGEDPFSEVSRSKHAHSDSPLRETGQSCYYSLLCALPGPDPHQDGYPGVGLGAFFGYLKRAFARREGIPAI